jgi:hypothetical protein
MRRFMTTSQLDRLFPLASVPTPKEDVVQAFIVQKGGEALIRNARSIRSKSDKGFEGQPSLRPAERALIVRCGTWKESRGGAAIRCTKGCAVGRIYSAFGLGSPKISCAWRPNTLIEVAPDIGGKSGCFTALASGSLRPVLVHPSGLVTDIDWPRLLGTI